MKLFVNGFPGQYGGAATELLHQIRCWLRMGEQVGLIPTDSDWKRSTLLPWLKEAGVTIHPVNSFHDVTGDDAVFGWCSQVFLANLPHIRARTRKTVFVNCMTWLFDEEMEAAKQGLLSAWLYQNDIVRRVNQPKLEACSPEGSEPWFSLFVPYFDPTGFVFHTSRDKEMFGLGRISRADEDKFSKDTIRIYSQVRSPRPRAGFFLGWDNKLKEKLGEPPPWITLAANHLSLPVKEFYRKCDIVLQPTDTNENWPRVGFEAMESGSVLVVDNRGGWQQMVKNGKTGFLCDHSEQFIHWASRLAFEPNLRADVAEAAREHGRELGSWEKASDSWRFVLDKIRSMS
jgi:hypothetical protein